MRIESTKTAGRATTALLAVLLPGWAIPALAAPVVPILQGPTGFAADATWRGPEIELRRVSIRAELLPDLAVIEQTYSVSNPAGPIDVTMGLTYRADLDSTGEVVVPLAANGWLDGKPLPAESVRIQSLLQTAESGAGWKLPIRVSLPAGDSILSLVLVLPTVPIERGGQGVSRPIQKKAHLQLEGAYTAWAWGREEHSEGPEVATALTLSPGVEADRLTAVQWMTGAVREGDTTFWPRLPNMTIEYDAEPDAIRIRTLDGLRRAADELVTRSIRGHIDIPASATPVELPGRAMGALPIDSSRTRRAMLVPAVALLTLLSVAYVVRRRWEKRF